MSHTQRIRRRFLVCLGAMLVLGLNAPALATPAQAHPTVGGSTHQSYQDWPSPDSHVATSGQAQCGLTQQARTGGWLCFGTTHPNIPSPAPSAVTPDTMYCNSSGCYYRNSNYETDWISNDFVFGIGSEAVGSGYAYLQWTLSGVQTTEGGYFEVNKAVSGSHWSGALYNGAPGYDNGGTLKHSCTIESTGSHPANTQVYSPSSWCTLGDSTSYDHNMLAEMPSSVSGYSGYWWLYTRSVVAHTSTLGHAYIFDAVNKLPGDPWAKGYDA